MTQKSPARIVRWPAAFGCYEEGDLVVWSGPDRPVTPEPAVALVRVDGMPEHWVPAIVYRDEDGVARRIAAPNVRVKADEPVLGRSGLDPELGPIWGVCFARLMDVPGPEVAEKPKRTRGAKAKPKPKK